MVDFHAELTRWLEIEEGLDHSTASRLALEMAKNCEQWMSTGRPLSSKLVGELRTLRATAAAPRISNCCRTTRRSDVEFE